MMMMMMMIFFQSITKCACVPKPAQWDASSCLVLTLNSSMFSEGADKFWSLISGSIPVVLMFITFPKKPSGIPVQEFPGICLHKIPGGNSREFMHIASLIFFSSGISTLQDCKNSNGPTYFSNLELLQYRNPTINYRQQHKTSNFLEPAQLMGLIYSWAHSLRYIALVI